MPSTISNIEEGVILLQSDQFAPGPSILSSENSALINNDFGRKWIHIENRSSWALGIGSVPKGGLTAPTFVFTVRPLSIGCYPIDATQDLMIGYANMNVQANSSFEGGNDTFPIQLQARNILYRLSDDGAPFVTELYPLSGCLLLSRRTTLASAANAIHSIHTFPPPATPGTLLLGPTAFGNDTPQDACIVAMTTVIRTISAANQPDDLSINPMIFATEAQQELFSLAGVAGAVPAQAGGGTPWPINGAVAVEYLNTGPGAITFRSTYWIGIPGHIIGGQT